MRTGWPIWPRRTSCVGWNYQPSHKCQPRPWYTEVGQVNVKAPIEVTAGFPNIRGLCAARAPLRPAEPARKEPSQDEFVDVNGNTFTWWAVVLRFTSTLTSKSVFNECALPRSHSIHGLTLTHILIHWYFQRTGLCKKRRFLHSLRSLTSVSNRKSSVGDTCSSSLWGSGLVSIIWWCGKVNPNCAYLFFIHSSEVFVITYFSGFEFRFQYEIYASPRTWGLWFWQVFTPGNRLLSWLNLQTEEEALRLLGSVPSSISLPAAYLGLRGSSLSTEAQSLHSTPRAVNRPMFPRILCFFNQLK